MTGVIVLVDADSAFPCAGLRSPALDFCAPDSRIPGFCAPDSCAPDSRVPDNPLSDFVTKVGAGNCWDCNFFIKADSLSDAAFEEAFGDASDKASGEA